jgi:O-antigen/teichoic acid export membrane protein
MLGRHLLGYLPVQAAQALVGFGGVAVFTRILSAEEFGRYSLAIAAVSLIHMASFTWLESAVARFHARADSRGRLKDHLLTVYKTFGFAAMLVGALLTLVIAFAPFDPQIKTVLAFALASMLLRGLLQIGLETHRAAANVARYSALEASGLMIGFMVGVGLILTTDLGAAGIFAGIAIAAGIMVVVDLPVMLRKSRGGRHHPVRTKTYARYGVPISFSLIFEHLLSVGDRFLIALFLGQGAVGMYAAGYGLADRLLDIIFIWFGAAVWPLTIKALEQKGPDAAKNVAGQAAGLMALIAFPAAAGLALVAGPLTTVVIGEGLRAEAAGILPWIALSGLMNGMMTYYFHEAFTLTRKTGAMATIMALAAGLNLGLNLLLIPLMGIVGAAVSTVIAYTIALIVCAVLGRRHFALPLPWVDWLKAATATMIMAAAVYALPQFETAWLMLLVQAVTGGLVYVAAALVLDIAHCRSWISQARNLFKPVEV